ncbi:MAG TPA: hypothetical protein VF815_44725 [Myxococcaceae bacterium]
MTSISLQRAEVALSQFTQPEVNITFKDKDAERFEELTTEHLGERLALLVLRSTFEALRRRRRPAARDVWPG